jgi:hypothetical protein
LTENGSEAGQSNTEEVHSESVNDHLRIVLEGHASSRDILSSLWSRRERVSINEEESTSHERKLTSMGRSFPLARISFAAT